MNAIFTLLAAALSIPPAHANPTATPIVEGDRIRVELSDDHAIEGRLVEVWPDAIRVVDFDHVRRTIDRHDVVATLREESVPGEHWGSEAAITLGCTAAVLSGAFLVFAHENDPAFRVSNMDTAPRLALLFGAPFMALVGYGLGRFVDEKDWVPAPVDDGEVRRARLRIELESQRRRHAPPRPVGLSLSTNF